MIMTTEQSDASLLREFATRRSQEAFATVVSRHSDWVYSAALRLVRDRHLAEDVAQAVFLVLADKAGKLGDVPLHRWLFKVTRYAAANAIRARQRRDKYERLAAMAHSEIHNADPDQMWQDIAPVLDDSISRLRSKDRDALLLRFYQQKNLSEVAAALGVSEGAAKIRVLRAIEKLRTVMRRRGIVAPSDVLGAVLLAQTTHTAPLTFVAGCVSASASIQATSISQGVSTMLISAKLKMLAAVILLTVIPIGAGAIFLAASDHPLTVPSQGAAPAITAPAAPQAALDPRVAPFVDDSTDILIEIDLTKLDVDALAADLRTELAQNQTDPAFSARINGMIQMGSMAGKMWINGFKQAGGTTIFYVSRADQLTISSEGHSSSMTLNGTIVYPAQSAAMAQTLAKYVARAGSPAPKVIGDTVVVEDSASDSPEADDWSGERPALANGLAAAGDAPIRASINPRKLKDLMPKLMASGHMSANFKGDEWDDVEYCSMNLILPPAQNPELLVISHRPTAAAAEKATAAATQRIAEAIKSQHDPHDALAASMAKFIASEKFAVRGSDAVATMNLHAYWDLIFAAMRTANRPAVSQPQGHAVN
jgi:RNA polymerase sigma factor (sigma-70 family)